MFSSNTSQVSGAANYIEDVFSTYLIKTPGSATAVGAVNNGIDLSTKGGMVWLKDRNFAYSHTLVDSARGVTQRLISDSTAAQASTSTYGFTSFNTNGFTLGAGGGALFDNGAAGTNVVTWTFRKQPKFFDVVTFTTTGAATQTINHNLLSAPGCIVVKDIANAGTSWVVYHRAIDASAPQDYRIFLNLTNARSADNAWGNTAPTSTQFTVGGSISGTASTYVAYIFAHNAGGFGLTGTDNVISCGSFNPALGFVDINLGYEPQWILFKRTDSTGNWRCYDTMRGWTADVNSSTGANAQELSANLSDAEVARTDTVSVSTTGFRVKGLGSSGTYIYIAIRRGPMKVPTSGTSVFSPVAYTGNATDTTRSAGFPVDMLAILRRSNPFGDGDGNPRFMDRLRGGNSTSLISSSASAEETSTNNTLYLDNSVGFKTTANNAGAPTGYYFNVSTNPYIAECFRRAPSFMDVVCYTGTGVARTINHNLGVAPELMIVKSRSNAFNWSVYNASIGATNYLYLNLTTASSAFSGFWNDTSPTASVFSVGGIDAVNGSGFTYVAYLFATCAGVSKVGSYTGTGATQTIACGFTGGARFVLVKRTDSTGDWYVWDTARGMVSGTDPSLLLNSTAAEVNANSIYTTTGGFQIVSTAAGINASGGSYIFLAVS